jgi:hypothetical protein
MTEEAKTGESQEAPEVKQVTMSQEALDKLVQERIARTESKYAGFEEMQSELSKYREQQDLGKQKELEEQKRYEELKDGWSKKEQEYQDLLKQKEDNIAQERIVNSLGVAVSQANAYPEAIDLLRSNTVYEDGQIKIKGKDSNGMDGLLSVEEGVKQFLDQKPYLVKASGTGGSGTPPAGQGGSPSPTEDLVKELSLAQQSGDRKKVNEIKTKMRARHAALGGSNFA